MENLNLLYITTKNPLAQGDLLEVGILHGLRSILGDNCVDYPEKKVMYHDWSSTKKDSLHGRGFTLYKLPIKNIDPQKRNIILNTKFDAIIFGTLGQYDGYPEYKFIYDNYDESKIWYLDGHDLYGTAPIMKIYNGEYIIGNQKKNSFKRELVFLEKNVYPTGFGIPEYQIKSIDLSIKNKLLPKTAPSIAIFGNDPELGTRNHHVFTEEEPYYKDMQESWFGVTCKKGGWDCLRHYEIIASGALLLFKDYDKKPQLCSPQNLPCYSYSSKEELDHIMNRLVINNNPTDEYVDMLNQQRQWLFKNATTTARAKYIVDTIKSNLYATI